MISVIVTVLLSVAADQLTKLAAVRLLKPGSVTALPGVLDFTYVENRGAAFGILADHRWVFLVLSAAAIAAIFAYIIISKPRSRLLLISLGLIAGGGIGNMIDRVRLGYVVDFIDVTFVKFYVFNIADSCVCVGCALLILWMILSERADRKEERGGGAGNGDEASCEDAAEVAENANAATAAGCAASDEIAEGESGAYSDVPEKRGADNADNTASLKGCADSADNNGSTARTEGAKESGSETSQDVSSEENGK